MENESNLIESIRKSMRITHKSLDFEIENNINACLDDMERTGIDTKKKGHLYDKACELYCKWQSDYQGKGDTYFRNYENLRDGMSLSKSYKKTED